MTIEVALGAIVSFYRVVAMGAYHRTMGQGIWMLGKRYSAQGPRRVLIS
jgi:hypothetical protein